MDHSHRQHSALMFSDNDSMPDIHDDELLAASDSRKVQSSVREIETKIENKFVNMFQNHNAARDTKAEKEGVKQGKRSQVKVDKKIEDGYQASLKMLNDRK